ncbi:MAG: hypothetical protein LAT64_09475 [Phycisphaerales bacterium]|nr:hypothetical protein [Planctomycetota bacterium]MCH8508977.1 hypothetical protein [Phycisphaerales bacterium]
MPDARTETNRTETLRLARTESIVEARPKPEVPGAEEMFLSPRVLDAGAFARYAEVLKSLIGEARQGARDLQDFSTDADQMIAHCEKSGEQLRTRLEAGARVVKLIDERSDRAERLLETVRAELPDQKRLRELVEPVIRDAVESARERAAEIAMESERRARAAASDIEQKLAAMSAKAADQAERLDRAGRAIEERLAGLESRLSALVEQAGLGAEEFERRTKDAAEHANESLAPSLRRAEQAGEAIEEALAGAWRQAERRAGQIAEKVAPLERACEAVIERLGMDPNDPDPSRSILAQLDGLVQRSESSVREADRVIGRVESLQGQAEGVQDDFARWLLQAADQLDELEAKRERLTGPLTQAAEKIARVTPRLADDLEIASTQLDHLETEQRILREAVQSSAMLARTASGDLNNQSAQLKALIDGSVHTLTRRVEEAGQWLGELIMRAEAAGRGIAPAASMPARAMDPTPAPAKPKPATPNPTQATQTPAPAPQARPTPETAPRDPAPPQNHPQGHDHLDRYGLPRPPSAPIDAMHFDGADIVFGCPDRDGEEKD